MLLGGSDSNRAAGGAEDSFVSPLLVRWAAQVSQ
jgi:hypothetical protein